MIETSNEDVSAIRCPWCGSADNNFDDLQTDGCLVEGRVEPCVSCGRRMCITAVEYDVTVYVARHEGDPPRVAR